MNESSSPLDDEQVDGKYSLIAPCVEDGMSIAQRSRETGVPRSTLTRMIRRCKADGVGSLERKKRSDKGSAKLDDSLVELIKAHLIALPHQSCKTIQRMIARICSKQNRSTVPTYWNIYRIQKQLPQDLLTLSKDSKEYKRLYELVHRFEASGPNEIWVRYHL